MGNLTNLQVVENIYRDFASGNMAAVFSSFHKDIVWQRPGPPVIPFAGKFIGIDEVSRMFALQATSITIKIFEPNKFCTNEDTVVVLGNDEADVLQTGKTYAEDWVQAFTLKDGKVASVQVYMDTKAIADAFTL
jgi:ketosteroid isomerase-like protein